MWPRAAGLPYAAVSADDLDDMNAAPLGDAAVWLEDFRRALTPWLRSPLADLVPGCRGVLVDDPRARPRTGVCCAEPCETRRALERVAFARFLAVPFFFP